MAILKVCDGCGHQDTEKEMYTVSIYGSDDGSKYYDLCKKCFDNVVKCIEEQD